MRVKMSIIALAQGRYKVKNISQTALGLIDFYEKNHLEEFED